MGPVEAGLEPRSVSLSAHPAGLYFHSLLGPRGPLPERLLKSVPTLGRGRPLGQSDAPTPWVGV